jgi:hypothetical protein
MFLRDSLAFLSRPKIIIENFNGLFVNNWIVWEHLFKNIALYSHFETRTNAREEFIEFFLFVFQMLSHLKIINYLQAFI